MNNIILNIIVFPNNIRIKTCQGKIHHFVSTLCH
jgi:hypothetical protein